MAGRGRQGLATAGTCWQRLAKAGRRWRRAPKSTWPAPSPQASRASLACDILSPGFSCSVQWYDFHDSATWGIVEASQKEPGKQGRAGLPGYPNAIKDGRSQAAGIAEREITACLMFSSSLASNSSVRRSLGEASRRSRETFWHFMHDVQHSTAHDFSMSTASQIHDSHRAEPRSKPRKSSAVREGGECRSTKHLQGLTRSIMICMTKDKHNCSILQHNCHWCTGA